MEARILDGVAAVPREAWDRLVPPSAPFLEWTYLDALEACSATPEHGVLPQHVSFWEDDELVAALPLYVKGDGRGEFIYDYAWAVLAHRMGLPYYPKAVSMPPFTPATSSHVLTAPGAATPRATHLAAETAERWGRAAGLEGLHWLFVTGAEADEMEGAGWLKRRTFQLRLHNPGWTSFDDYLGAFRAKHRIKIRRELRRLDEQGLELEVLEGDDVRESDLLDMYAFYENTCEEHGTGSLYLKRGTWQRLADWRHRLLLCFARHEGRRVGGSLCVHADGVLHGRYWGCRGHWASLYFNLAFYAPLRIMIERGWRDFFAGFGNARYKHARGFEPAETLSVHRLFDERLARVLADYLSRESELVDEELTVAAARSRLRS